MALVCCILYFFRIYSLPRPRVLYEIFVQYYSETCRPSDHTVGKSWAEIRTRDGQSRGIWVSDHYNLHTFLKTTMHNSLKYAYMHTYFICVLGHATLVQFRLIITYKLSDIKYKKVVTSVIDFRFTLLFTCTINLQNFLCKSPFIHKETAAKCKKILQVISLNQ